MDATVYHLEARAPFHFGLRGVGIEATALHGPSDTLFSALCHAIRYQFGLDTLQGFLGSYFDSAPPVVLSSAFPYVLARREEEVEDWQPPDPFDPDQAIRFFPRPIEPPPGVPDLPEERKTVKKITWVSEDIFRAWTVNDSASLAREWVKEAIISGQKVNFPNLIQGRRVWLTADERGKVAGWRDEETDAIRLWATGDVPRVTVDRRTSASAVYQAGRVWFQPGGGLWLLARWRDDWRDEGELALRVLSHEGIGGERSAGHGLFRLYGPYTLLPLPDPMPGERFLTISLYHPTKTELPGVLEGDQVSYRFLVRRGWMASPDTVGSPAGEVLSGSTLRRKAVRMFAEGSILRWLDGKAMLGDLADVTPEAFSAHRVYRYGLAFPVGLTAGSVDG